MEQFIMIIGNQKPIRIIGYSDSSMTQEFVNEIRRTHACDVIAPQDFMTDIDLCYQYIVSVSVDFQERKRILEHVDRLDLDVVTYIHENAIIDGSVAPGSFVFPFCKIGIHASIGRHCIIGPYSMIGHSSTLNSNCILRPGVMVTGKSTVGNNCVLNIRSTVTNKTHIVDHVELKAFSTVTKNITKPGVYIGSPARLMATSST